MIFGTSTEHALNIRIIYYKYNNIYVYGDVFFSIFYEPFLQ